jgi:quercetin dioxygenase-like cupin family protein
LLETKRCDHPIHLGSSTAATSEFHQESKAGRQFSVWESIVPPGRGAPAHTHTREDEAFYVLSGEVLVEVEGVTDPLRLGTGAFLFAPRHRRHGYRNVGTTTARLLVLAMPGTGLDRMFAAFDEVGKQSRHTPAIQTIAAIAEQYGPDTAVLVHCRLGPATPRHYVAARSPAEAGALCA